MAKSANRHFYAAAGAQQGWIERWDSARGVGAAPLSRDRNPL
jgi:hypothetical protein